MDKYLTHNLIMMQHQSLTFIDLFCGIGGFHSVLKDLGHSCVLACDIDKHCREVYQENYGIKPHDDVKKLKESDIPDFDILCGGFPCQAFSNAGKKKTFNDERGLLFDEIIRIALEKKPKFMFLENVKHILRVGDGNVILYIEDRIKDIGYSLQMIQMSPHDFGIPQQRERIYFICIRNDIFESGDQQPVTMIQTKNPISKNGLQNSVVDKFLMKKEDVHPKYFLNDEILYVLNAWDEMIKAFDVNEKISPTILVNEFFRDYTEKDFQNMAKWRRDYIIANKPLYEKYKHKWNDWFRRHKHMLGRREIYAKLEWQVGTIKENDSIFNYFIQLRQSGIRVKKTHYFPTLVAISQIPIYGKEKRYITPREGARLQSFPDSFKLPINDKYAYKQLGNSVNCSNVRNVIQSTLTKYASHF